MPRPQGAERGPGFLPEDEAGSPVSPAAQAGSVLPWVALPLPGRLHRALGDGLRCAGCCSWPGLQQPSPTARGAFPTGWCWPAKITDLVWFLHGFLGAGLLVRMRFTYLTSSRRRMFLNNLQITERFISSWGRLPASVPTTFETKTPFSLAHPTANVSVCACLPHSL